MKVLWLEVTEPSAYVSDGSPIAGWQDSLERIVKTVHSIELVIAFVSNFHAEVKVIDGVTYVPIYTTKGRLIESVFHPYWDVFVKKVLPLTKQIVEAYKPDLIQVFGVEWPFGQIAKYTDIPVVVHIMGGVVPYNNASYPPGYSYRDQLFQQWWNPKVVFGRWLSNLNMKNWEQWERRTWSLVKYYMGRTQWDEALSRVLHPGRSYYHVEEALRLDFLSGKNRWKGPSDDKLRLISTGCSTFWKGPDMMLKVAKILIALGVDFEWQIVGNLPDSIKHAVEKHEKSRFGDCHIHILGFKKPKELIDILCSSTLYVHTAYIENSPNSICEAQCLGLPVISTNVGGISSLVHHNVDGLLVAANDPWQMADAILELTKDKKRMKEFSDASYSIARNRHADENIKQQLLDCYQSIIKRESGHNGE